MATTKPTRGLLVLLGLLPLACAHAAGAAGGDASAGDGPVTLKFAWPEGFKTHVLIAHQTRRRGAEPTGILAHQLMVSERKGNELWVSTRETAARGNDPDLDATVKINEALIQVVAPDGKFVRAEGLDQAMAAMKPSEGEDRDNTRRALARSTASDWETMVGGWVGQTLRVDEPKRKKLKTGVPLFSAVETTLEVEQVLEGRVPCTDEETERRCVEVTWRGRIAPDDRAATVERIKQLGGAKPGDPTPEDIHADVEIQLVTEPNTLIPHRMTQLQRLRVRMRLANGRVQEADERSEDVTLFTDRPPSGAPPSGDGRNRPGGPQQGPPPTPDKGQAL